MSTYKIFSSVSEDKGKVRKNNEDNFYLNGVHLDRVNRENSDTFCDASKNSVKVYAVFDGMGGEELGEEASLIAAEVTKKTHNKINEKSCSDIDEAIGLSIDEANTLICEKMKENGKKRIGATYTSLVINDGVAKIYNVGDSRAYLLRDNQLRQLSVDDTSVQRLINIGVITDEQARVHPDRHRLTQHLGIFNHEMIIEPHISKGIVVLPGDKFLLCSDGLTDMVEDSQIEQILNSSGKCKEVSEMLVSKALENGGKDNVTAMVVCVEKKKKFPLSFKKKKIVLPLCILLSVVVLITAACLWFCNK